MRPPLAKRALSSALPAFAAWAFLAPYLLAGQPAPEKNPLTDPVVQEFLKQQAYAIGIWRIALILVLSLGINFVVDWMIAKALNPPLGTAYNTLRVWVYGIALTVGAIIAGAIASLFGSILVIGVGIGTIVAAFKIVMNTYGITVKHAFIWMALTFIAHFGQNVFLSPLLMGEAGEKLRHMSVADIQRQARKAANKGGTTQSTNAVAAKAATPAPGTTPPTSQNPTLQQRYDALMDERKRLDPKNPQAVARFNKLVAEYNEAKKQAGVAQR